jgi:hypothetical protein
MHTTLRALLVATGLLAPLTAQADVKIEPNAFISRDIDNRGITTLVGYIQLHGYRCDSLSYLAQAQFFRGFAVACNGGAYEYKIRDRGGQWVVELDD